jgi:hypothetical protein
MTETGIANLVLSHLGASGVTSINDLTPEAEAIRDAWDGVRDALIRSHRWNFAKTIATLTPVTYGVSYQLPSDFLRLLTVNGVEQSGTLGEGAEVVGKQIYVAAETCDIVYLRIVPNPEEWDSLFAVVFAYELAAACGPRLANGSLTIAQAMREGARIQLQAAMSANAIETRPTVVRAIDGSRYYQAVWGGRVPAVRTIPAGAPPSTTTPTTPTTPTNQPVIEYIIGTDGATYEKTTMPNGSVFYKPVFTAPP